MHGEEAYTVFFGFGIIWVVMGVVGGIALLKVDNQPIRFGKWGLLVASPIIIGIIAALVIAAMMA